MNYQVFELINGEAGRFDWLDDVMEAAATWLIYVAFAITATLVVLALYRRRVRPVLELGVTLAVAFVAATAVAHLSAQVRPFQTHQVHQLIPHEPGLSLPSDHATAAFALAFGVGLFLHRRWGLLLLLAALVVGVSRIWVGVHYPGDIAVAVAIAGLAAAEVGLWSRWRAGPATANAAGRPDVL